MGFFIFYNFLLKKNMPLVKYPKEEIFKNTESFRNVRRMLISKNNRIDVENIFDMLKSVEIESFKEISENAVEINFFDYTSLYLGVDIILQEKPELDLEISENYLDGKIYNSYLAGCSRHIFMMDADKENLNPNEMEQNKKTLTEKYNLRNLFSLVYNFDKKIFHFKFSKFESALEFSIKLKSLNKRFGFQRRKGEGILHNLRTVYLGNVTEDITTKDIESNLKGGSIYAIKMLKAKRCAFVTFLNPWSAEVFISFCQQKHMFIKDKQLKVTPANPGNLPLNGIICIAKGATRILKIKKFQNDTSFIRKNEGFIEIKNNEEGIIVSFATIIDAYNISKNANFREFEVEFLDDPCDRVNIYDMLLYLEQNDM